MGFVSGFTGGVTLTLGIAYLSVLNHERNRNSQALYLRSQSQLLNSIVNPEPQPQPPSRAELVRASRGTFSETAKDRWNQEVEGAVRRIQTTDWDNVRQGLEGAIARLLGKGLEQSREGVEKAETAAAPKLLEAVDVAKAGGSRSVDRASAAVKVGADKTREAANIAGVKAHELASAAKNSVDRTAANAKSEADHAAASTRGAWNREVERSHELKDRAQSELRNSTGTVDAARGVVRDAFSKSVEKGQELIGKAQVAVGLAKEKVESTVEGKMAGISEVDRALNSRYEKLHGLDKSVDEVLEDRYKPVDQRS